MSWPDRAPLADHFSATSDAGGQDDQSHEVRHDAGRRHRLYVQRLQAGRATPCTQTPISRNGIPFGGRSSTTALDGHLGESPRARPLSRWVWCDLPLLQRSSGRIVVEGSRSGEADGRADNRDGPVRVTETSAHVAFVKRNEAAPISPGVGSGPLIRGIISQNVVGDSSPGGISTHSSRWYLPFLWIVFIPLVTVPSTAAITDRIAYGLPGACQLTPGFFGATAECPQATILLMLTPGLLNLVPALWLRSHHSKMRLAASWASTLGAVRLIVPAAAVLTSASGASISQSVGPFGGWTGFPNAGYGPAFTSISLMLWLATLPALWIVSRART